MTPWRFASHRQGQIAVKCAKCQAPVQGWETYHDIVNGVQVFTVFCHGERDRCTVDFRDHDPRDIVEAVAFRQAMIGATR